MRHKDLVVCRTLGYIAILLLLACNSNVKKSEDSTKISDSVSVDKSNVVIQEKKEISHHDTIIISEMQFHPADLHVKKGATVVWINKDIVVHDATEFPDKTWTSGPLSPGSSWKMKVDKSYDYFCSIHITMKGKLTVDP